MFQHSFAFDSAGYLLLLMMIPLLWWVSYRSLAGLGRWRRLFAIGLRSLVLGLIVLSLADMQYRRTSDQMTVIYLLDQSLSIPTDERRAMIDYVNESIEEHLEEKDRFAVVVFGQDAAVEIPLVNVPIPLVPQIESLLDPEYTDLAMAIQRAKAMFPHDAAKRIVLVTDGNQNLGNAQREARSAAAAGISIDVVPVMLEARSEVAVEKVDIPAGVRRSQPFDLRVVLQNDADKESPKSVPGKLYIIRKTGDREDIVAEQSVDIPPGKRVYTISQTIDEPDFYTYEARFTPDDPAGDGMLQNNIASAFTHVRGKGHVLLIENWEKAGEFDKLVNSLRGEEIEVTVTPSNQLFNSLAELQRYDSVILANVSRSSGTDESNVSSFSDAQIDMLVRNTREMGCGLIMMGGPDTYGAGGWTNTELEKAMPVDFQIKNTKVIPVGALVLMMHAGEMPKSNYWQKRIAVESIKLLGDRDYCGLVQWNGTDQWLWGQSSQPKGLIRVGVNRKMMMARVDRMSIGDMPAFDPALKMAATAFAGVKNAAVKHMIVISDGDPTPPTSRTIGLLKQQGVKVSTVAVTSHGSTGSKGMSNLATATGGKYYVVKSARALPRIYQREARRIAKPLVHEMKPPRQPSIVTRHEIVQGLDDRLPPISGFVLTSVKENPLVEVVLRSPVPVQDKNAAVLAVWTYGAGKAVALTTDAGARWADRWTEWENYDKLFSQTVRWSMRPTGDIGNFNVATDVRDGKTQVIITAMDSDEEFLNDQAMAGTVVAPDMSSLPLRIEQTAPGRYIAEFESKKSGSYLIVINPGAGRAPIRTGVNVGYSSEYRDNETNLALLESLAKLTARNGPPGVLIDPRLASSPAEQPPEMNPFRRDLPKAISAQSIWPWLVMAGSCLFLADVFVRRVQINLLWVLPALATARDWVLRRDRAAPEPETMSRLQSRKREIGKQIESRQRTARFEPSTETPEHSDALDEAQSAAAEAKPSTTKQPVHEETPDASAELSYTERLLKAKRESRRDRNE